MMTAQTMRAAGRLVLAGAAFGLLASCMTTPTGSASGGSFKKQYLLARKQLETGKPGQALATYTKLAQERGPFESRILLELGHAYLRVADFDAARRTVSALGNAEDTRLRAAALAVSGTAEQELAQSRLAAGDKGKATRAHLKAAEKALSTMLKLHSDMDQTGAMAARLTQIKAALKSL